MASIIRTLYDNERHYTNDPQKIALLLHVASPSVQDLFYTLQDPGIPEGQEDSEYKKTLRILDAHFQPQINTPYERHVFKQLKQDETRDN